MPHVIYVCLAIKAHVKGTSHLLPEELQRGMGGGVSVFTHEMDVKDKGLLKYCVVLNSRLS